MRYLTHNDKLFCAHGGEIKIKTGEHALTANGAKVLFKSEVEGASIQCPLATSPCSVVAAVIPTGPKNIVVGNDFPLWDSTVIISATGVKSILVPSPTTSQLCLGTPKKISSKKNDQARDSDNKKEAQQPWSGWIALKLKVDGIDLTGGKFTLKLFGYEDLIKGSIQGDGEIRCKIPEVMDFIGILEVVTKDKYQIVQRFDLVDTSPDPNQLLSNLGFTEGEASSNPETPYHLYALESLKGWIPKKEADLLAKHIDQDSEGEIA